MRYNFGAGPAMLPADLMHEVQDEWLDWHGQGLSIVEIGHRTPPFQALMEQAETDLRDLLSIPETYSVLFLGGAARTQFAMIPMNLIAEGESAGYCVSGVWSKMAYTECLKLSRAYALGSSEADAFTSVPHIDASMIKKDTSYVYYTPNETVNGTRFAAPLLCGDIPLVADMTSCLLSESLDIEKFGLIFAGSQKNIAPAGLTVVIIRSDLLMKQPEHTIGTMFDYRTHVAHHSLYATPPTFNCYFASKMFQWVKKQGGVAALERLNIEKSTKLYDFIDASDFYQCRVERSSRSRMNVCFSLTHAAWEDDFLQQALEQGLYGLQGHRIVGGLRASLYNAMPMSGVDALIAFMQDFMDAPHG